MAINIVLFEPEIPQNTGNIARTCALTGIALHLIKPLGFSLEDKYMKRAGLDYWHLLSLTVHENFADFLAYVGESPIYFASTKATKHYAEMTYPEDCFLLFGKESAGLPPTFYDTYREQLIRIPMRQLSEARSLNLSNSVAIVLYEVLRQHEFLELR